MGGTASTTVQSGTNSGNNGANWTFGGCLTGFTQKDYRWYQNTDAVQPTTALAAKNTSTSISDTSTPVRLRMSATANDVNLATSTQAFKLQFSTATSTGWADVGPNTSSSTWRFKDNASVATSTAITSSLLVASNITETYEEQSPTAVNPNTIAKTKTGEWDFALDPINAVASTTYYFRMIRSSGIILDYYTNYPQLAVGGATATLTQAHYRWYQNANDATPTSTLAATDFSTVYSNIASSTVARIRMNLGVTVTQLGASTQAFKLQYATSTGGPWSDVGAIGSAASWRGYDNTSVSNGTTLSSTLITSSTVAGSYVEQNNSAVNPNAIPVGGWGEWDWVVQNNGASLATKYYFRMVKSAGTALDAYTNYPTISSGYTPSGSVTSLIIDTAVTKGVAPNSLLYEGVLPANTTVKFQFAASNSSSGPWTYTAWNPNTKTCDTNSFYDPVNPSIAVEVKAVCYQNKRYLRYKMTLTTTDSSVTPRVDRIILNYAK